MGDYLLKIDRTAADSQLNRAKSSVSNPYLDLIVVVFTVYVSVSKINSPSFLGVKRHT